MNFEIQSAALVLPPEHIAASPASVLTVAQRRGLKYQAKVEKELSRLYNGRVLLGPWFRYKKNWETRRCQPDAIVFSPNWDYATIVEVKYSTTAVAWQQLSTLYKPVVEKTYRIPIGLLLITRLFDPHVAFPCSISQLEGLEHVGEWRGEGLAVVSWK